MSIINVFCGILTRSYQIKQVYFPKRLCSEATAWRAGLFGCSAVMQLSAGLLVGPTLWVHAAGKMGTMKALGAEEMKEGTFKFGILKIRMIKSGINLKLLMYLKHQNPAESEFRHKIRIYLLKICICRLTFWYCTSLCQLQVIEHTYLAV